MNQRRGTEEKNHDEIPVPHQIGRGMRGGRGPAGDWRERMLVPFGLAPSGSTSGGGTLTIQGDAGDPTLTENFNPFSSTELGGTRLIYEPLEILSSVNGTYTPFLATGYSFTNPTTLIYTLRTGREMERRPPVHRRRRCVHVQPAEEVPGAGHHRRLDADQRRRRLGQQRDDDVQGADVPFAATIAQSPIVPEHVWTSVPNPAKFANTKPVGTGPFTLAELRSDPVHPQQEPAVLEARKIAPTQVKFPAQSSNQSTNQLDVTSGKFDWSYNFLPDVKQTFVARDPAAQHLLVPAGRHDRAVPEPDQGAVQRRQLPPGSRSRSTATTIAQKAVNGYMPRRQPVRV